MGANSLCKFAFKGRNLLFRGTKGFKETKAMVFSFMVWLWLVMLVQLVPS